ncbi:MAG: ankyrin repeat domain-containing protein [Puniceicoccales bacterium]|nr:ankyrin repeat domain-containing protein [Puniceicoccales bacterium]
MRGVLLSLLIPTATTYGLFEKIRERRQQAYVRTFKRDDQKMLNRSLVDAVEHRKFDEVLRLVTLNRAFGGKLDVNGQYLRPNDSLLHIAVRNGDLISVVGLVSSNYDQGRKKDLCNINACDALGRTPYMLAIENHQQEIADFLEREHRDLFYVTLSGTALHVALNARDEERVQRILSKIDHQPFFLDSNREKLRQFFNKTDFKGKTSFHLGLEAFLNDELSAAALSELLYWVDEFFDYHAPTAKSLLTLARQAHQKIIKKKLFFFQKDDSPRERQLCQHLEKIITQH